MRIQYLSDVHIEFHADAGESFVASLDPTDVDVLVVAGDFAVGAAIEPALGRLCQRYASARVLYVHGNHEFYGTTRREVVGVTRAACRANANLEWLDGDVVTIDGARFVGTPLWFRHPGEAAALSRHMNDFAQIEGFERWVYEENARALAFLDRELAADDVALTHYLPSQACVVPRWRGNALNPFFVCDVEPLIRARTPEVWIHGHTHDSVVTVVGATCVLANPFGYVGYELNSKFKDKAMIEVAART